MFSGVSSLVCRIARQVGAGGGGPSVFIDASHPDGYPNLRPYPPRLSPLSSIILQRTRSASIFGDN